MKAALLLLALLAHATILPTAGRAAARFSCDDDGRELVRLGAVSERLDISLTDGRVVYFPTLDPPRATPAAPDRPANVAGELTSLLAGKDLAMQKLGERDRWGRIPARLYADGRGESADEILIGAGLVMAGLDNRACGEGVLAAEKAARADKLGIWADPDYAALSADAPRDFTHRSGTLAVVEGRVASIGHTAPRLYLNLGAERRGLTLTIARRNQPAFERAGLTEAKLLHKSLQARGVVEIRAGTQIELFHPGQIEFMEGER